MRTKEIAPWRAGFSMRLVAARENAGLTQREAAECAGVSAMQWNHWERGRRVPCAERLVRVAEAVQVPVSILLGVFDAHDFTGPGTFLVRDDEETRERIIAVLESIPEVSKDPNAQDGGWSNEDLADAVLAALRGRGEK